MQNFFLFLKGMFVGLGKIIPGVSGSLIAAVLNIYEESIYAINHIKDDFKKSMSFLFPIGMGVLVSICLFSHVLLFFFKHYYGLTMFFFLGLLLGTVPKFRKSFSFPNKKYYLLFVAGFLLPFLFSLFSISNEFIPTNHISSWAFLFFLGFLDAFSMVIPGISGTALFIMLGSYSFLLNLFQNPFVHVWYTFLFMSGLIAGIFLVSKWVELCFAKNKNAFFIFIYGLLWSSIFYLFSIVLPELSSILFLPLFLLLLFGFFLSYFLS